MKILHHRRIARVVLLTLMMSLLGGMAVSSAQTQAPLIVTESVVLSGLCILNNQFLPNERIVWRIKVIDPATGAEMAADQLERVWVELEDGQVFDAYFAPHPPDAAMDHFWTAAWTVPEDYPMGIINYEIYAKSNDGRQGTVIKFNVPPSMIMVVPSR